MKNILLTTCIIALASFQTVGQNKVKPVTKKKQVDTIKVIRKEISTTKKKIKDKEETTKSSSTWWGIDVKVWLVILAVVLNLAIIQHLYITVYKEKRDKKKKKRYLVSVIGSYDVIIQKQLGKFPPFLDALSKKNMDDTIFNTVIGLTKDNVDAVPRTEAYNVFVNNQKGNNKDIAFNDLYNNIDWVDALNIETIETFKDSFEKSIKHEDEWYKNIDEVRKFHDKYLGKVKSKEIIEPFMLEFFLQIYPNFVDKFVGGVAPGLFKVREELWKPAYKLCQSKKGEESEYVHELLDALLWADKAFQNYEKNIDIMIKKFESLEKRFEEAKSNIKHHLSIINK
ncbi:MAG TPA: hypothetical protein DCS93_23990 [Microscillaceae bacterium]|nr:hypothetical protein [Microscillaceae bacterium]